MCLARMRCTLRCGSPQLTHKGVTILFMADTALTIVFMADAAETDALVQGPDAAEQLVASFTNDHLLVATDGEVYR